MVFVPAAQVTEVSLNQSLHGQQIQNTLYGIRFGEYPEDALELLAGEMATWVGSVLYTVLSTDIVLREVVCRRLNVADGEQFIFSPSVLVNGDVPNPALPGNVAMSVSFRTGLVGRSRRGRNYVAGICEQDVVGNQVTVAFRNALQGAYDTLLLPTGPFQAAGFNWVVLSRYSGKDPVTGRPLPRDNGQPTFVSSVVIDDRLDSQRRRLNGRGS